MAGQVSVCGVNEMSPETQSYVVVMPLLVVCLIALIGLFVLRDKYYRYVEDKLRTLLTRYPVSKTKVDDGWARIDFHFYYPFLLVGRETKIQLYVHWSQRRRFLNDLFKLSFYCSLLSLLMPFILLINVINFHNNVFRYP